MVKKCQPTNVIDLIKGILTSENNAIKLRTLAFHH
jgi:hypothetical protein